MRSLITLCLSLLSIIFTYTLPAAEEPPQIEFFSPQGTVKAIRQVSARFSDPMVSFGDPRGADPFTIDCPAKGKGRWADPRNWVYDFERDLTPGLDCHFSLKPDAKTQAGKLLAGEREFNFNTGGPSIRDSLPYDGNSTIDEQQVFLLAPDAKLDATSLTGHLRCEIENVAEQIGVEILTGDGREKILAQRRDLGDDYKDLLQIDGETAKTPEQRAAAEADLLVVRCQRAAPPATKLRLVWGAGIKSQSGIATEQDQIYNFTVRSAFTAQFSCRRIKPDAECLPMLPMNLYFSAQVPAAQAAKVELKDASGKVYPAEPFDPEKSKFIEKLVFAGPFPEQTEFTLTLPAGVTDDSNRALENAARFPLTVKTDSAPPLAKFSGNFGIIEAKPEAVLPVTLRNLEAQLPAKRLQLKPQTQTENKTETPTPTKPLRGKKQKITISDEVEILRWLARVEKANEETSEEDPKDNTRIINTTGIKSVFGNTDPTTNISIEKPLGEKEFEVIGIPLATPGFYVVELASPRLGEMLLDQAKPRYVSTAVLVTNLAAHFKWGGESSLVWVTTLDQATPISGAEVVLRDCQGKLYWQGQTDAQGVAAIAQHLPDASKLPSCDWGDGFIISARYQNDMTFVLSTWTDGISPWDFNLQTASESDAFAAHTVLDRTLLRAGETVHMKHFLRKRTGTGFAQPDSETLPKKLVITHQGSEQQYEAPLTLDSTGLAATDWPIPKDAKYGTYNLKMDGGAVPLYTGSFRVEAFRIPTMKAVIQPPAEPLVNASEAHVDLLVSYLSGGGAANLPIKLRTQIREKGLRFPDYDEFTFGGGELTEGFAATDTNDENDDEDAPAPSKQPAQVLPLTLDKSGALRATIPRLPKITTPHEIEAELEYQDANGEILTAANRIPLWPATVHLGLRTEGWTLLKDEPLKLQAVVLDLDGKPVADREVQIDLYQSKVYSHRKRLIGGFYAYESSTEVKRVGEACTGTSDAKGLVQCEVRASVAGDISLQARTTDASGNQVVAVKSVWVAGQDEAWFASSDSDRMDVLPERKQYEPGETAKLQVRMPFRAATALVTVEREGILERFVTPLSGKEPVIEVPIKDTYAPNAFISVLAVRGRAGEVQPTAQVDLGKPSFRLGIASINVGWKPYQLDVKVTTDQSSYKVRDAAKAKITVTQARGGKLPEHAEIAFAAVDEGLLELMPNKSWQLLETMMEKRGIDVTTATAQMQVVGKRHYGRKAVAQGGGGGRQAARELFDTLLLWKHSVPLDERGEAEIEVPLNDSLTAFRLVAIANAGADLFGTGKTSIQTTQDLMLHSGLPTLVREGDLVHGMVTVRNASERKLPLMVDVRLTPGKGGDKRPPETLAPQELELAPGEARVLSWPVDVPEHARQLVWEIRAEERNGTAMDRVKVTQEVIPMIPVKVYQATLQQLDHTMQLPLERPADALPGRGGIRIHAQADLGDELVGVRDYMQRYPYACLEQQTSKAIALGNQNQWEQIMAALPQYLDGEGLLRYFPDEGMNGSEVLTSYVLTIAHEAGWGIPESYLKRLQTGLKNFVEGRLQRTAVFPVADLSLRKLAAIDALARYNAATPEMVSALIIDPNTWPTSAVLDWLNVLQRLPAIPNRNKRLADAEQILRARLNFQGSTLNFSTARSDKLWWLMVSNDVNAVRSILTLLDRPHWRADLPKLAHGALLRQAHGHWDTTTANAWGVLALAKFSQAFEAGKVTGETVAQLGAEIRTLDWQGAKKTKGALEFGWPEQKDLLTVTQNGKGKPWMTLESRAAIPLKAPLASGYTINREIMPVEQKDPGNWSRGDVIRVHLDLEAQSDMTWVVVDDPIPAGASILGSGLGRDSSLLSNAEDTGGTAWPAFSERRQDAYRAYYEWVPKGKWTLEYTLRLNNPGKFVLPPTRVEALYAPEMFAESPNDSIVVGE